MSCEWPVSACECWLLAQEKGDHYGRIWMHCDEGLSYSKVSMTRFVMFCLGNNIEIGDLYAFNPKFPMCQVSAAVKLRPDQFDAFEKETKGKLRKPPVVSFN